ncbi:glycosyltransferase family 2 protein [Alteromonas macleodii]|uniref:glycosyltransferase family 2 protein n=1 Tax=Alteromonas macleodii TaxID=28108 RepID=UPI00068C173E|nr:glycosyltransferase family 2 protein [Alteromonas macleodii]
MFSVVIPTYNRTRVVANSINSVLNQTFQDFEIIVVDDGSDDIRELRDIVSSFGDNRIVLIEHKENRNGSAARNTGIDNAKFEFVLFLDSDDIWPPTRLELALQNINSCDSDLLCKTVFYGRVRRTASIDSASYKTLPVRGKGRDERVGDYLFIFNGVMQTSTIMCHISVAKMVKFDEALRRHQDYDFCLRAEANGMIFSYTDALVSYWINDDAPTTIESVDFRYLWIKRSRKYLSEEAYNAYLVSLVMPFAFRDKKYVLGTKILLLSFYRCPNFVYLNALKRLPNILKSKPAKRKH